MCEIEVNEFEIRTAMMRHQLPFPQAEISCRKGCFYLIVQHMFHLRLLIFPVCACDFFKIVFLKLEQNPSLKHTCDSFAFLFVSFFQGLSSQTASVSSLVSPASFLLQGSSFWIYEKLIKFLD